MRRAYPNDRLGGRACAVVIAKPDQNIYQIGISTCLKEQKITLQYIPGKREILPAMLTTPSAIIQKFQLRE